MGRFFRNITDWDTTGAALLAAGGAFVSTIDAELGAALQSLALVLLGLFSKGARG